jgi:hypothetical protein
MATKILCPGWDNLSPEQKQLATEWIESLISCRIPTAQLSDSLFTKVSDNSLNLINDNTIKNFQFEVVDSSNTSEGISITEIISPAVLAAANSPPEGFPQAICIVDCMRKGNSNSDCVKKCT